MDIPGEAPKFNHQSLNSEEQQQLYFEPLISTLKPTGEGWNQ